MRETTRRQHEYQYNVEIIIGIWLFQFIQRYYQILEKSGSIRNGFELPSDPAPAPLPCSFFLQRKTLQLLSYGLPSTSTAGQTTTTSGQSTTTGAKHVSTPGAGRWPIQFTAKFTDASRIFRRWPWTSTTTTYPRARNAACDPTSSPTRKLLESRALGDAPLFVHRDATFAQSSRR